MWRLGQKAQKAGKLPSECLPGLVSEIGDWGIYCFDNAIYTFTSVIENALNETEKIGMAPNVETKPKYSLDQLLEADFRLPAPRSAKEKRKDTGRQVRSMFAGAMTRKGKPPKPSPLVQLWMERKGKAV